MNLREKTLKGIFWSFLERFSVQIIQFVVGVILARLLLPREFGLIGMIVVFIALGQKLTDSGLTSSLIRTKNADDEDYSTVFYVNLAVSVVIYYVLFLTAPLIAAFYDQAILTNILRIYGVVFIIRAFSAIQSTRLTAMMDFRTQMMVQLPSIVIGGIVGILLAIYGWGVWSLVYMHLVQTFTSTCQLWIMSGWVPQLKFNCTKLHYHFDFGYKLALSSIINVIYDNIYYIIIGRYFSATHLGFYTRAQSMKQIPVNNISSTLGRVTYPLFSSIQHDNARLRSIYRRLMQQVLFWIAPILIISGVLAEPIFRFLFTDKWLPAVPYFQILCIAGIMYPLHFYNLNVLKVKGRSDIFLKLTIVKKFLVTIGLLIAIPYGIFGLLWLQVILNFSSFFLNTYYSGSMLDYGLRQQILDIWPIIAVSGFIGLLTAFLDLNLPLSLGSDLVRIIIVGTVGMLLYLWICGFLRISAFKDFKRIVIGN